MVTPKIFILCWIVVTSFTVLGFGVLMKFQKWLLGCFLFNLKIAFMHCEKMCCNCGTKVETTFILGMIYTLLNFLGSFGGPYGKLNDIESFEFLYFNVAIGLVATLFGGILIYGTSRYVSRKMKYHKKSFQNLRFSCLNRWMDCKNMQDIKISQ